MGYYLKTWIAVAVMLASIAAFCYAIYSLIGIGTCASGNTPYVIATPCPAGVGLIAFLMGGGIVGFVIGFFVLQWRGDPPGGRREGAQPLVPLGWALWGLFFLAGGIVSLAAALRDPSSPGMLGPLIVGITFIPMGIGPLVWGVFSRRKSARAAYLMQHGTKASGVISNVADTGVTINMNPYVRFTVTVHPPSGAPFDVVKTSVVSRLAIPRIGQPVIVWYDPNDHSNCVLGVPTGAETAQAPTGETGSPAATPPDSLDRLERLVKLRDEGALTPEEFETQKAHLLGES
jgi:putative oligomerization/nucleic acid binding protein